MTNHSTGRRGKRFRMPDSDDFVPATGCDEICGRTVIERVHAFLNRQVVNVVSVLPKDVSMFIRYVHYVRIKTMYVLISKLSEPR